MRKLQPAPPAGLNKAEFGARWQISPRKVTELIAEGLPVIRLGHRTLRICPQTADQWLAKNFASK